jgi:RND superfamily putative drug exporter
MFQRLGRIIPRLWWFFLIAWPTAAVVIYFTTPPIKEVAAPDQATFLPESVDSKRASAILRHSFPEQDYESTAIVLFRDREGFTSDDFKVVDRFTRWLARSERSDKRLAYVKNVLSPTTEKHLASIFISNDNQVVFVLARLTSGTLGIDTQAVVDAIIEKLDKELPGTGLTYELSGDAVLGYDYGDALEKSIKVMGIATVVLVVSILLVIYRSPVAPIVPLVAIGISFFVSRGLVALIGKYVTDLSDLVEHFMLVILFGAGTDYCLFFIGRYREELTAGYSHDGAISRSVTHVGAAVAASAGTTILGLVLMAFADFKAFRTLGPCVGLALGIALVAGLTLIPAMIHVLRGALFWPGGIQSWETSKFSNNLWSRVGAFVTRLPVLTVALVALVTVTPAWIGVRMRPNYDIAGELPASSRTRIGAQMVADHFGVGTLTPITLVVETPDDLNTATGAKAIEFTTMRLRGEPFVKDVWSLTMPLGDRGIPLGEPPRPVRFKAGKTVSALANLVRRFAWETTGVVTMIWAGEAANENYVSRDGHVTWFAVSVDSRAFSHESMDRVPVLKDIARETLESSGLKVNDVAAAGATALIADIRSVTTRDLVRVVVLVILGVYVVLVILLRSVFGPVYLILTMLWSYAVTMGVDVVVFQWILGHEGVDWKVRFFLFVLMIAMGVDYNIFLLSRYREESKRHPTREAMRRAIVSTGGIISSCGFIVAGTFLAFMAGKMAFMRQVGFAIAFGMILDAFLMRPSAVPAIALLWDRFRARVLGIGGER